MSLDILTFKGQISQADEQAVARWFNQFPGFQYIETPKDLPAAVDAILVEHGRIIGVVETKCRYNMSIDTLRNEFGNEWLITAEKVRVGMQLAKQLCVPFFGFLFIVQDNALLIQNLSTATMRKEISETRRTINGGIAVRENVFVLMDTATVHTPVK